MSEPVQVQPLDDLAHLAAAADEVPPIPGAPVAEVPAPPPSQAQQLAAILLTVGSMGAMRFPSLNAVFTEEKCQQKADAIAPALERLGISLNHGETMLWLGAGGACLMLALETRTAIIHDIKAEQAAAGHEAPAGIDAAPAAPIPGQAVAAGMAPDGVHSQMALYR